MSIMGEKGIGGRICHKINRYAKANNKYMKNYNEDSNKGQILEVDVEYPKNLLNLEGDLPFLAKREIIKKCKKLVCNIYDKDIYVVHMKTP